LLRLNIENSAFRVRSGEERRKAPRAPERRSPAKKKPAPRPISGPLSLSVTVSVGLAESQPRMSVGEVIEHADKALYKAKQGGRNRVEMAVAQKTIKRSGKSKKSAQG